MYPVTADPVLYVTTDHDAPAFELTCTLYPTIGEPLSAGAVHVNSTDVAPATPARFDTAPGAVAGATDTGMSGVSLLGPRPTALRAATRNR